MKVRVFPSQVSGRISAPPSKSYTHRAVVLSSLAEGECKVINPLTSRDTIASLNACKALGVEIEALRGLWHVLGTGQIHLPTDVINVENSGTTLRLIAAVSALAPMGYTVLTGDESTRRRPMQPLLDALHRLGVDCWSTRGDGTPPIIVKGGGIKGGDTWIRGDISSQFISALLVSTPKALEDTSVRITGEVVSRPYIEATLYMLRQFQVEVENRNHREYFVPGGQVYTPTDIEVSGDFSSAAMILGLGALTQSSVTVDNLSFKAPQADAAIIQILEEMGAEVKASLGGEVKVSGGSLNGGYFNLRESPDLLPILAVLAIRSKGKTIIRGVEHTRYKETDRIANLARELPKFGVAVQKLEDGLVIEGKNELDECQLDSYGDHRLFMALCIAAAAASKPCIVYGAESVDISYPDFIADIGKLGVKVEVL